MLDEFHWSTYVAHPGYQKLFSTIKRNFFWPRTRDITKYLAKCLEFQQVEVKHQHCVGLLHPLPILELKWHTITMDFIIRFPKTRKLNDSIMVMVDKWNKTTHFIPVKSMYKKIEIADIFMKEMFQLHGIPRVVICDRDVKCTSSFLKSLFSGLGTQIQFSIGYHPQTDG